MTVEQRLGTTLPKSECAGLLIEPTRLEPTGFASINHPDRIQAVLLSQMDHETITMVVDIILHMACTRSSYDTSRNTKLTYGLGIATRTMLL